MAVLSLAALWKTIWLGLKLIARRLLLIDMIAAWMMCRRRFIREICLEETDLENKISRPYTPHSQRLGAGIYVEGCVL